MGLWRSLRLIKLILDMSNRYLLVIGAIVILVAVGGLLLSRRQSIPPTPPAPEEITDETAAMPAPSPVSLAQPDTLLPSSLCTGKVTSTLTEGPYYKAGSPERTSLREPDMPGEKLILSGYVFDKNCQPIVRVWLDFWQADSRGRYDNSGFTLRGHQFTDNKGYYEIETIVPLRYGGRPPHIHVKVRVPDGPTMITQLFFPGEPQNETDTIFHDDQVIDIQDSADGKRGTFHFVLNQ